MPMKGAIALPPPLATLLISIFGQQYKIEALISKFEVSSTVWNVLTPE